MVFIVAIPPRCVFAVRCVSGRSMRTPIYSATGIDRVTSWDTPL